MHDLSTFHDVRFPVSIAFGATGASERRNEIIMLSSGYEKRNARFANSRRKYDAGTGVRSLDDLYDVLSFFEARRGSLHAFRFRDPFDMKSCKPTQKASALDQLIGTGNGQECRFALIKTYGEGSQACVRLIDKPVKKTISVAVDGKLVDYNHVFFDEETKEIVFLEQKCPQIGQVITAGFEFDVPVRFDCETISASITTFQAGQIPSIPLIEVRV